MNRLKEIRESSGISVAKLAEDTNISRQYIYDLESGNRRLNEDYLIVLSDYFEVSIDYLLCRDIEDIIEKKTRSNVEKIKSELIEIIKNK